MKCVRDLWVLMSSMKDLTWYWRSIFLGSRLLVVDVVVVVWWWEEAACWKFSIFGGFDLLLRVDLLVLEFEVSLIWLDDWLINSFLLFDLDLRRVEFLFRDSFREMLLCLIFSFDELRCIPVFGRPAKAELLRLILFWLFIDLFETKRFSILSTFSEIFWAFVSSKTKMFFQ